MLTANPWRFEVTNLDQHHWSTNDLRCFFCAHYLPHLPIGPVHQDSPCLGWEVWSTITRCLFTTRHFSIQNRAAQLEEVLSYLCWTRFGSSCWDSRRSWIGIAVETDSDTTTIYCTVSCGENGSSRHFDSCNSKKKHFCSCCSFAGFICIFHLLAVLVGATFGAQHWTCEECLSIHVSGWCSPNQSVVTFWTYTRIVLQIWQLFPSFAFPTPLFTCATFRDVCSGFPKFQPRQKCPSTIVWAGLPIFADDFFQISTALSQIAWMW